MREVSGIVETPNTLPGPPAADRCPLVLGECVQGRLGDGRHFLITTPIDLASEVVFTPELETDIVATRPADCSKAHAAVEHYLREEGLPGGGLLEVERPLPPGHGFGTSTADIVAGLRAAAAAWGRTISPERISRIAISLEPSDGTMYPGCVAYAHRTGELLESFGPIPPFKALAVLNGNAVDTVAFDHERRHFRYSEHDQLLLREAWALVREGTRRGRIGPMAQAGTISAKINQQLLPKPLLEEFLGAIDHLEAEGLFIAHSGSIIALVFDTLRTGFKRRWQEASRFVSDLSPETACFSAGHAVDSVEARGVDPRTTLFNR